MIVFKAFLLKVFLSLATRVCAIALLGLAVKIYKVIQLIEQQKRRSRLIFLWKNRQKLKRAIRRRSVRKGKRKA